MWTVMDLALAGVPHHFGFCTRVMRLGRHRAEHERPARQVDRPGRPSCRPGSSPTFSMTWAGTRLANSICQSAKVVLNFTVTVWPPFEPVTDAMSR